MRYFFIVAFVLLSTANSVSPQVLDKQMMLDRFGFWQNKDWSWYKKNIPFMETPDQDIDLTWYYRWEMMTAHLVYGSAEDGYAATEFIDRPWWSGTYGAISCAAGHQLYEFRWFRDPVYAQDYASYFFNVKGAQPRNYSTWIADAVWQVYKTYGDRDFALGLLPQLTTNYAGWEKEHYVTAEGMFAWDGMHDGMETNINSRQTKDWFAGAPGYRPTLNSYMWADALAIAALNNLEGNAKTALQYQAKAAIIKNNFLQKCWDPKRNFFFHRFQNDEEGGIKANSLTYETGKYAGNPYGRELIGFIPWYFNMPDTGYESAWISLLDTAIFAFPFGPATVEKRDPLFRISENCCAWSGNAWPFATAQTLKGMANLIKYYPASPITKDDYYQQLLTFAKTHRKNGQPYIAEANHPQTGSWSGHDVADHSEHYFHSSYIDLVITGLLGLEPMATDSVEINPMIPDSWDYFALDDLNYHGHRLSVFWDRSGKKYKRKQGLSVMVDGKIVINVPTIRRLVVPIAKPVKLFVTEKLLNIAVNNSPENYYPRAFASFPGIGSHNYLKMNDGQFFYYTAPANRWTTQGAEAGTHFAGIDFGSVQEIDGLTIYFIEDSAGISAPKNYTVEYWNENKWRNAAEIKRELLKPMGSRGNYVQLEKIAASKIRILFPSTLSKSVGISEIEVWSKKKNIFPVYDTAVSNAAYFRNAYFSASYTSRFDNEKGINDGLPNPANRWTAFESPNVTDWVAFQFNEVKKVSKAVLFFYNDKGGVQPPERYEVQYWNGKSWAAVEKENKIPRLPLAHVNMVTFLPIKTNQVRIIMTHRDKKTFSGLYEVEIY